MFVSRPKHEKALSFPNKQTLSREKLCETPPLYANAFLYGPFYAKTLLSLLQHTPYFSATSAVSVSASRVTSARSLGRLRIGGSAPLRAIPEASRGKGSPNGETKRRSPLGRNKRLREFAVAGNASPNELKGNGLSNL